MPVKSSDQRKAFCTCQGGQLEERACLRLVRFHPGLAIKVNVAEQLQGPIQKRMVSSTNKAKQLRGPIQKFTVSRACAIACVEEQQGSSNPSLNHRVATNRMAQTATTVL